MQNNDNSGPRCRLNEYGKMLSESRVRELLDYATGYGEHDHMTAPNPEQRSYIKALRTVLGEIRTPT